MINPKETKKMWVWNDPTDKHKRFVLVGNDDGSCVAVTHYSDDKFLKGGDFSTVSWKHCEEIKEPKKRYMTHDEVVIFMAQHPTYVMRYREGNWIPIGYYAVQDEMVDDFMWTTTEGGKFGEPNEFLVEVTDD